MESWKKVWREGFAPVLSTAGLEALADGLRRDDPAIVQGMTTSPLPLQCTADLPVEAGCFIAYACWKDGLDTVGEVEEAFARACFEADQCVNGPAGCRHALNWFDETPRDVVIRELLPEVERELARRKQQCQSASDA